MGVETTEAPRSRSRRDRVGLVFRSVPRLVAGAALAGALGGTKSVSDRFCRHGLSTWARLGPIGPTFGSDPCGGTDGFFATLLAAKAQKYLSVAVSRLDGRGFRCPGPYS